MMSSRIALTLILCLSVIGMADCIAQDFQQLGWREFPRRVTVLNPEYRGNYNRSAKPEEDRALIKKDFFIFQKRVTIAEPIFTNGGNVLIAADEVEINAPIDTRVHFTVGPDYWISPSDEEKAQDLWPLDYMLYHQATRSSFDSLYLWRERYDPNTKTYRFDSAAPPNRGDETTNVAIPQLPSGQVPLTSSKEYGDNYGTRRPADGEDAPDKQLAWSQVRSGSIRIYANRIKLCAACEQALNSTSPPVGGDPGDLIRAVFLYTSGIKGGRGGAGSVARCAFDRAGPGGPGSFGSTCQLLNDKAGGLSGKPGRGGDAGDIEIYFVNSKPTAAESDLLTRAAKAESGRPPNTALQRTPSYRTIATGKNRSVFTSERPLSSGDLSSLNGRVGSISIKEIDTTGALNEIAARLVEAEISGNYTIDLMVKGAQEDPSLFTTSPADILRPFLGQELARLQQQLLAQAETPNNQTVHAIQRSPFFGALSCHARRYHMRREHLDYLERMCAFAPVGGQSALRAYFLRTGGLFRSVTDVNVGVRHEEQIQELKRIQDLMSRLLNEVASIRLSIFDRITTSQREGIASAIEALIAKRNALEAAAAAAMSDRPGLADTVQKLGEIGKKLAAGYAEIIGGQWEAAAPSIYEGLRDFGAMITNADQIFPTSPDLASLDHAIDEARAQLNAFEVQAAAARDEIVRGINANLRDLVDIRNRADRRRTAARFKFTDLLRATFQEYPQSPFDPQGVLRGNLKIISNSLPATPEFGQLDVKTLRSCESAPVRFDDATGKLGCVEIERGKDTQVVSSINSFLLDFPLVVVSPGSGSVATSFGHLFAKEEVAKTQLKSDPTPWR